jgi:peptidoglycan/xylan/chitin deacetylase (PgdA/CDA1 family)
VSLAGRFANRAVDLLFVPGTEHLWARRLRGRVLCLLYHRVDDPARHRWLARRGPPVIAPRELERELAVWKRLGARFTTFRELRDGWFPGADEVGVLVCFDDGYRDNCRHGFPLLARLGIPATLFQISSLVGADELNWEHALYFLQRDDERAARFRRLAAERLPEARGVPDGAFDDRLRFAAPQAAVERLLADALESFGDRQAAAEAARDLYPQADDLRRTAVDGFEIGSHGARHLPRTRLDDAEFERDLADSRQALAALVGAAPECYSFPYGLHREGDEAICRRHYRQAAVVRPRPIERDSSPWELPRATWPGPARNGLRLRRWLLRGRI